jgi:hypothetical protein
MIKMRTIVCFVALVLVAGELVAQVAKKQHSCLRDFTMSIPFDGGLFLIMAGGIIYGATVLYSKD